MDYVRAYFGMRKISLGRVGGEKNLRPLLNDKFVFHMGMLDQVRLVTTKCMVSTLLKMHRSPSAPTHCLWIACTPLISVESACVIIIIVLLLVSSLLVILFVWIHL